MNLSDAFARMETAGGVHLANKQEFLAVAAEVCQKILAQFKPAYTEEILLKGSRTGEDGAKHDFSYTIWHKRLLDNYAAGGLRGGHRVLANPETALRFVEDVRNGLLDVVSDCLRKRGEESTAAVSLLKKNPM